MTDHTDCASRNPTEDRSACPRTIYLIKQLERAVRAHLEEITREQGLTAVQYTVLSVLERKPGIASAQLARRSFVSPQAGHEMVVALERKGFVERQTDASNRRVVKLFISDEGRRVLRTCHAQVDGLEAQMLIAVEEQERHHLRSMLDAGIQALRKD